MPPPQQQQAYIPPPQQQQVLMPPPKQLQLTYRHNTNNTNNQAAPPIRRIPAPTPQDACSNIRNTGRCEQRGCRGRHGRYNASTNKQCKAEQLGKPCSYLYMQGGCTMAHYHIKN